MTSIDIGDITKNLMVTVDLTGIKKFRARLWLASWVFRLGAWIAGINAEIETKA